MGSEHYEVELRKLTYESDGVKRRSTGCCAIGGLRRAERYTKLVYQPLTQLTEIHGTPEWLWPALVERLIADGWTVETARKQAQRVKSKSRLVQDSDQVSGALVHLRPLQPIQLGLQGADRLSMPLVHLLRLPQGQRLLLGQRDEPLQPLLQGRAPLVEHGDNVARGGLRVHHELPSLVRTRP